jgi:hypothetical protein
MQQPLLFTRFSAVSFLLLCGSIYHGRFHVDPKAARYRSTRAASRAYHHFAFALTGWRGSLSKQKLIRHFRQTGALN